MFDISRRDLTLGAAGAYAAFGLNKTITFVDAAYAQQSVTQPFRKYTVGDIEVFSLIDGMRDAPLREGMVRNVGVEQVKAALRAAGFPDNQTPVRFIVMALKLRDQVVLIDSGTGGHRFMVRGTVGYSRVWRRQALTPRQSRRSSSPTFTATTFMAS
jgi:hypothetical protein